MKFLETIKNDIKPYHVLFIIFGLMGLALVYVSINSQISVLAEKVGRGDANEAGFFSFSSSKTNKFKESAKKKKEKKLPENEFAPIDPDDLDETTTQEFIRKYKYLAVEEMHIHKIPASITLAQAIIESRSGNSRLAKNINNFFGIKCHSKSCKKGHCENYSDDSHKDFFMKFKSAKESFKEHSKVVLNSRYTKRTDNSDSYVVWANALQDGGYATGDKYAAKLIRVINQYDLDKYDK